MLEIVLISINESHRGRGFGTLFSEAIYEIARSTDCNKVILRASPQVCVIAAVPPAFFRAVFCADSDDGAGDCLAGTLPWRNSSPPD